MKPWHDSAHTYTCVPHTNIYTLVRGGVCPVTTPPALEPHPQGPFGCFSRLPVKRKQKQVLLRDHGEVKGEGVHVLRALAVLRGHGDCVLRTVSDVIRHFTDYSQILGLKFLSFVDLSDDFINYLISETRLSLLKCLILRI